MCGIAIPANSSRIVVLNWGGGEVGISPFCSAPPGDVQPHLKTFLFVTVGARVLGVYRRVGCFLQCSGQPHRKGLSRLNVDRAKAGKSCSRTARRD